MVVAPRVGAWIEIKIRFAFLYYPYSVAPRVGAWIEISKLDDISTPSVSLPVWERGLKLTFVDEVEISPGRSPRGSVD